MISVIVYNKVKTENQAEFIKAAMLHREATFKYDKGCKIFEVMEPTNDTVTFIELWENKEYLDAHAMASLNRPHITAMDGLRDGKEVTFYKCVE